MCLVSGDLKSLPSNLDLQDSASVASSYFMVQQFSSAAIKLGFDFPRDSLTQKPRFQAQKLRSGRAQLSMQVVFRKSTIFLETLISSGERERAISPCESCPIQASSDTMLKFHMLS